MPGADRLFERTGRRALVGRKRYSLWTGDPGTALYLALCVEGSTSLPGFDDNDFV